jgi:hypothetical protein
MPERRRLAFDRIEAIMPDVDRLIAGHATVGRWTLGAICDHLARTINLALDSPPADAPATREQVLNRRLFFRAPAFPEGQTPPLPAQTPTPDADPIASSESLRTALARLAAHDGPFPAHPLLGPLTRSEWLLFHARHAAHHLSFAVPT